MSKQFVLAAILFCLFSQWSMISGQETGAVKSWRIARLDGTAVIDGKMTDPVWSKVTPLTDFKYAGEPFKQAPVTELRLFHNGTKLFFFYTVEDADQTLVEPFKEEFDVASEDRVEIVMDTVGKMKQYYCLEMDCRGRVLDYCAQFYRKFDFGWTFPELQTAGTESAQGYTVEGVLDLATLRRLGILSKDQTLSIGFFRAQFKKDSAGKLVEGWINWVDSGTKEPDFHVPSSLGKAVLE